jgi:hypothetical protein
MIGAHVAGLAVDEMLLSLAPVGGVLTLAVRDLLRHAVRPDALRARRRTSRSGPRRWHRDTNGPRS